MELLDDDNAIQEDLNDNQNTEVEEKTDDVKAPAPMKAFVEEHQVDVLQELDRTMLHTPRQPVQPVQPQQQQGDLVKRYQFKPVAAPNSQSGEPQI